jgi:hypothetical protein
MADATVAGGVRFGFAPGDGGQGLPSLTPQEEQAARLALSKLHAGSGAITSSATGFATPHGAGGTDSVMVGSGLATAVAGAQHPTILSGMDSVVAGSGVALPPPVVPPGFAAHLPLSPDTITQHGPTATGLTTETTPPAAVGVTMPDQTKINVAGVSATDLAKHNPGHK